MGRYRRATRGALCGHGHIKCTEWTYSPEEYCLGIAKKAPTTQDGVEQRGRRIFGERGLTARMASNG